jgi:integrase
VQEPTRRSEAVRQSLTVQKSAVVSRLVERGTLSAQSLPRVDDLLERFCGYCRKGAGIDSLRDVDASIARRFVTARTSSGEPAAATMHLRRSTLRLVFRTARELRIVDHDPTLDLRLPPRSETRSRPLTDDEVALCRAASLDTLTSTRLAAAWALAEASARSAEIGQIRLRDFDVEAKTVWIHGSPRTLPRRVGLSEWGRVQILRRLRVMGDDPEAPIVYGGSKRGDAHRQAASCVAIGDVLRKAGLHGEPDVRPISVAAWAGQQILTRTGRIDEVARRLGIRSLDRTARLIAWNWSESGQTDTQP